MLIGTNTSVSENSHFRNTTVNFETPINFRFDNKCFVFSVHREKVYSLAILMVL